MEIYTKILFCSSEQPVFDYIRLEYLVEQNRAKRFLFWVELGSRSYYRLTLFFLWYKKYKIPYWNGLRFGFKINWLHYIIQYFGNDYCCINCIGSH